MGKLPILPGRMAMTRVECAEMLGVSPQAIAATERNALRKLRIAIEAKGWTAEDVAQPLLDGETDLRLMRPRRR